MPDHDTPIDGLGRSISAPPLTRRESIRLRHERLEREAGHLDASERSRLLLAVIDEVDARAMMRADAHRACGLDPGSLDDGSLSTDALRAALEVLRGLPTP